MSLYFCVHASYYALELQPAFFQNVLMNESNLADNRLCDSPNISVKHFTCMSMSERVSVCVSISCVLVVAVIGWSVCVSISCVSVVGSQQR